MNFHVSSLDRFPRWKAMMNFVSRSMAVYV
jgi:hypothetical protein